MAVSSSIKLACVVAHVILLQSCIVFDEAISMKQGGLLDVCYGDDAEILYGTGILACSTIEGKVLFVHTLRTCTQWNTRLHGVR